MLTKQSDVDGDALWETITGGGGDSLPPYGEDGEVLTRVETKTAVNVIANPRFMGDLAAHTVNQARWEASRCSIVADATVKRHPSSPQSLKATITDASNLESVIHGRVSVADGGYPVSPGDTWTVMASVRPDAGTTGGFRLAIVYYNAAGSWVANATGAPTVTCPADTWTDLRATFSAAPAGAAQMRFQVTTSSARTLGANFWVGEVLVDQDSYDGTYFDGATADDGTHTFDWVGTADASPSNQYSLTADWEPSTGGGGGVVLPPVKGAFYRTAALAVPLGGSGVTIPFDTEETPAQGISYSTSTGIFTATEAGWYTFSAQILVVPTAANASCISHLRLIKNGVLTYYSAVQNTLTIGTGNRLTRNIQLAVGDTVNFVVYNSQVTANLTVSEVPSGLYNNAVQVARFDTAPPGGGGVVVERPVAAMRRHAAATSILNATPTAVPWDTEVYTDGITWDSAQSAFIAPSDGYYDVQCGVSFATNATGSRIAYISVNGASQSAASSGTGDAAVTNGAVVKVLAGQTIKITVQQTSGATLALVNNVIYNWVSVVKVPQSFSGSAVSTYGERNYATSRTLAATVSIATATSTVVPFDTITFEDGITTDGAGAFIVPVAGYYDVEATVTFATSNTTGVRSAFINVDGAQMASSANSPIASQVSTAVVAGVFQCAAGQKITVRAYQTSGIAVNISTGVYTKVSIAKVPAPVINGAAASGVWGVGELTKYGDQSDLFGRQVYIDSAGQLRAQPDLLRGSAKPPTDLPGTYPTATTVMSVGSTDAAAMGWPPLASCTVVTHRRGDADTAGQWCYLNSGSASRAWYRNGTTGAWAPWIEMTSGQGAWTDCKLEVRFCTSGSTVANAGQVISDAKYTKIGKTVIFQGVGTVGSGAVASFALLLPPSAGVPAYRSMNLGSATTVVGTMNLKGGPIMTGDMTRLVCNPDNSTGYSDATAGAPFRWNVTYEVV